MSVWSTGIGTWCALNDFSIGLLAHSFGPVQPFGARKTIIGQIGRVGSFSSRACFWMALIFSTASSIAFAITGWSAFGSSPVTKIGSQPIPSKYLRNSSSVFLDKIVGLEILNPLRSSIGSTAPSLIGLMNVVDCQDVASGPVSASPSPTTTAAISSGLSKIAPTPCESE